MSDAYYNKFPSNQPPQYQYTDPQHNQYPPQPAYFPPPQQPNPYPTEYYPALQPYPTYQNNYYPPQQNEVHVNYQYPSTQQLSLNPEIIHKHYESALNCLIISLFTTLVYQFIVLFSLGFSGFEVRFPWFVILGFACALGDLALLYLTIKYMRKSKKKRSKGKIGVICFGISFILFKLTYAFTFSEEFILVDDKEYVYSPSTGNLIMQYILRGINFVMGIVYLMRRSHHD